MANRRKMEELLAPSFVRELSHLLRIAPGERRGRFDPGWNCRDHALVTACLVHLSKNSAAMLGGRAFFARGPAGGDDGVGLEANPHAWVGVDGIGFFDLSPDLSAAPQAWGDWKLERIAASRCEPDGEFFLARTDRDYRAAVDAACVKPQGRTAVYSPEEGKDLTTAILRSAFDWVNSPLSESLRLKYDPTIYARAAVYLHEVLRGRAPSLLTLSQDEAWDRIASSAGDPVLKIASWGNLKA